MLTFTVAVDDKNLLRVLRNTALSLEQVITPVAEDLEREARQAGGQVTPKLGAEWKILGTGGLERKVEAPEWWAHFLAGGTKDHGPRRKPLLVFTVNGNTIHAGHVRGIKATHFDKKAIDRTRPHVPLIIDRIVREAALL